MIYLTSPITCSPGEARVIDGVRSSSVFARVHALARRGCLATAFLLAVTVVPATPAVAAGGGSSAVAAKDRSVPVKRLPVRERGVSPSDGRKWQPGSAVLPSSGSAVLQVASTPGAGEVERTRVGGLPVRLTKDVASSVVAPAQVRVEVADQAQSAVSGVPVLLRLDRVDPGAARARVRVEVDYSGFREAYGADWASRLRLVRMTPCAGEAAASAAGCGVEEVLTSTNDTTSGVVSASVDLAVSSGGDVSSLGAGEGALAADAVVALAAGTDSETGSFTRTSLAESSSWQAGQSAGDFSYSYPLDMPSSPGDLDPDVTFGYSSGAVDGRTNGESGQTSWLGEGWNYEPGYVERSYRSCKDDQLPAPTYTNATGDLCWREDNATLSWQGRSTELVRDTTTGTWRLADDDGSRIELIRDGADWNAAINVLSPGDFDGDGKADVLLRRAADNDLYLLRGNGTGGFLNNGAATPVASISGADLILSPGDFTGDGKADVLWRKTSDGTVYLLRGNGAGGWLTGSSELIGSFSTANVIFGRGDFSGDGKIDILWRRSSDGQLFMVRGNGTGGWITGSSESIGNGFNSQDLMFSTGDFTGDNKVDVITRDATTKNLMIYTGNGAGGFITGIGTKIASGPNGADIALSGGDFDGDGKPDVLWREAASKDLYLLAGNGTGGWKTGNSQNLTDGLRLKNGDDNGEHWRLTTTDGVQYYFGRSRLPGWTANQRETGSVWTAPVFGNTADEPCWRATGFTASYCSQAWRWNLDHVIDPHQNSISYWYSREQARTGLAGNSNTTALYERGGTLQRIEYGTRAGQELTGTAPMQVVFTAGDRCLASCWSGSTPITANWPDTPWDLNCTTSSCPTNISPSFWTTRRLAKVTTQAWNGSTYADMDEWVLTHQYPATGETDVSAALWLATIVQTGKDGGTKALPATTFGGTRYANRTDYNLSAAVPMVNRYRITRVSNETGGETNVTYEGSDCTVASQANPDNNPKRCFPQYYYPPAAPAPGWSWWNKYRVTKVVDKDLVGGSPDVEETYAYSTAGSSTTVLWHHNDGSATWSNPLEKRSWSDFRGWPTVTTTTGIAGQAQSQTRALYFRGMDGDRTDAGENTRDAKITNSLGEVTEDHSHLAGMLHEEIDYNGAGGIPLTKSVTTPWLQQTAQRQSPSDLAQPSTAYAYYTEPGTTRDMTWLAASATWRTTRTVNTYDTTYGTLTRTEEHGDVAVSTDDTCTTVEYARNTTAWLIEPLSQTTTTNCATTPGPDDTLSGARVYYDDNTIVGTIGSRGLPTKIEALSDFTGATPTYITRWTTSYDALGRVLTSSDALGNTTTTVYTPITGGPVTRVDETNPKSQTTTTNLNLRGLPSTVVDPNDKTTTTTYDPLGRQLKIWLPGRTTADTPNQEYVYGTDSASVANYLQTKTLGPNGSQISSFEIYDGHLRPRQTQTTAPDGKRVISDVRYDARGLVAAESAFYNNVSAPTSTLVTFTDATVPTQRRYTYDGTEDLTRDALWSLNTEKWHITLSRDGDRVTVEPPSGGIPTTLIEDALGRTTTQRQYQSTNLSGPYDETTYTYDRLDRLKSVTDADGNTWNHTYDRLDRLTTSTDPDAGNTSYTYDNNDQVITSTDGRGEVLYRAYDALGRPTELRDDNATGNLRVSWLYDTLAKGYPTSATRHDPTGDYVQAVTGYTDLYQPTGQTNTIPASQGALAGTYTTGYGYNPNGSPATTDLPAKGGLPAETVTYTYTDEGYLTGVTGLDTYLASAQYYWHGAVKQQILASGTKQARLTNTVDDATGRLTAYLVETENQTVPDTWDEKLTEQYTYDSAGNITSIAETNGRSVVANQCFGYDYLQRLTEAWTTTATTCQTTPSQNFVGGTDAYWHSYTYNKIGNRTTDTRHSGTGDTTRIYTYPPAGSPRPHALTDITSDGGEPANHYTYDNGGYLQTRTATGKPDQNLTYDAEGHLTQLANGATTHTYIYYPDGNRLIADNPGTEKTLYLDDTEYHLSHTTGQVTATRYYPNAIRTTNDGLTWTAANHQGTTQVAINATTLTTTRRRLTPFGEDRGAPPATWPDDKGFVGGTTDPTGYTHLGAREYDPTTGRFLSVDPLIDYYEPQHLNAYAYSNNSPITFTDPDGLQWKPNDGGGGGASAGGGGLGGGGAIGKSGAIFASAGILAKAFGKFLGKFIGKAAALLKKIIKKDPHRPPKPPKRTKSDPPKPPKRTKSDPPKPPKSDPPRPPKSTKSGPTQSTKPAGGNRPSNNPGCKGDSCTPKQVAAEYRANPANGVGSRRNVAVAQHDIDGVSGQRIGVSGQHTNPGSVAAPKSRVFNPGERPFDSENKIFEHYAANLSPNARGTINLYSERVPCPSCSSVIDQFREMFPGIRVNVSWG
ncbi:FG-GAP-like repeat-containing protein [Micromonospora sp. NPDC005806]|uniref:FG-GAP-like repeat-containing protein n=1 Tax=Micromonospora sp. NPDC005806 TaxID=3364234 RepID=UPI0036851DCE